MAHMNFSTASNTHIDPRIITIPFFRRVKCPTAMTTLITYYDDPHCSSSMYDCSDLQFKYKSQNPSHVICCHPNANEFLVYDADFLGGSYGRFNLTHAIPDYQSIGHDNTTLVYNHQVDDITYVYSNYDGVIPDDITDLVQAGGGSSGNDFSYDDDPPSCIDVATAVHHSGLYRDVGNHPPNSPL